ncbi:MAG: XisI protein, partial [Caldilineaceae bacterium]|nr:XisI protein [Caldilineaceae bacterium]MCB0087389.1 XisI protein [Caldilineaceae bacterium]
MTVWYWGVLTRDSRKNANVDLFVHNHKIYIEEDTSNQPIAESLLAAGVPKED